MTCEVPDQFALVDLSGEAGLTAHESVAGSGAKQQGFGKKKKKKTSPKKNNV